MSFTHGDSPVLYLEMSTRHHQVQCEEDIRIDIMGAVFRTGFEDQLAVLVKRANSVDEAFGLSHKLDDFTGSEVRELDRCWTLSQRTQMRAVLASR